MVFSETFARLIRIYGYGPSEGAGEHMHASQFTSRVTRLVVLGGLGALVLSLGFSFGVAQAAGATTKVEQGWELLSQQITNQAVSTTITLTRGPLTGTFTPTPSAVFEVTGKVTGGTNGAWTVELRDANGSMLASTNFYPGTDANANLHSVSFSNPTDAGSLSLAPSGTTPGTLSITKAYVRFKQNGVVQATDAHVSMTTAQAGITTSTYSTVFNPTIYRHVATDYSPAPTVKLRVTGVAGARTKLYVRLTTEAGSYVTGSEVIFSNASATDPSPPASMVTGALSLSSLTNYVVQARVLDVATQGPSGPSVSPTGDVLSADLELEQSTTNSRGLEKSVSWNQSVSAAVTVPPTGNLNFKFEAPVIQAPCSTPTWQTVVKGTSMTANMQDTTTGTALTSATVYTGPSFSLQPVNATVPTAGHVLDTTIGSGGAGTITWSALRYAMCLWDQIDPTITNFRIGQTPFNPNVTSTTFLADSVSDTYAFASWTLVIKKHADGSTVRTFTGTTPATPWSQAWNGKNDGGSYVGGGLYDATLTALDTSGNSKTALASVTVAYPAVVSNYYPLVDPFSPSVSPGTKDTTTFQATITGDAPPFNWTLNVKNSGGSTVKSFSGSGNVSAAWDGKDSGGAFVASGNYTAALSVTDAASSVTLANASITVDKDPPAFAAIYPTYLSGTGNGNHTTTIPVWFTDVSQPLTYNATIKDAALNPVRTLSGTALAWDGKNDAGVLQPDGTYTITLTATDTQNLTSGSVSGTVVIDSVLPSITGAGIDNSFFSPNGDGSKDATTATAAISDANMSSWRLGVVVNPGFACIDPGVSGTTSGNASYTWSGYIAQVSGQSCFVLRQPDGPYTIRARAEDKAGNWLSGDFPATIDTITPTLTAATVSEPFFSPNGDGTRDTTAISATSSDLNPATWQVEVKEDSVDQLRRTLTGTGFTVSAVWDGSDDGGNPLSDGGYISFVRVTDAAGNARSATVPGVITRDIVAPSITAISPLDRGNFDVALLAKPVVAALADARSGLTSSATVSLQDLTAGTPAQSLGNTITAGILRSDSMPIVVGHAYNVGIHSEDRAGNSTNRTLDFAGISVEAVTETGGPNARIARTGATEMSSPALGVTQFAFTDVPLDLSGYVLRVLGPVAHAGYGYLQQRIDLTKAKVHLYVSGVAGDVEVPGSPFDAPAAWSSRYAYSQFSITNATADVLTPDVMPVFLSVPRLEFTTSLPGVTRAVIEMAETPTSPAVSTCSDRTMGCARDAYPTTDPLPFRFNSREALGQEAWWADLMTRMRQEEVAAAAIPPCSLPPAPPIDPCISSDMNGFVGGLVWPAVMSAADGHWILIDVTATATNEIWNEIQYLNDFPIVPTDRYEDICSAAPDLCEDAPDTSARYRPVPVESPNGSETYCVDEDGNVSQSASYCRAFIRNVITELDPRRDGRCQGLIYPLGLCDSAANHLFYGDVYSTEGLNETQRENEYIKDEMLVGADTGRQGPNAHPEIFGLHREYTDHNKDYAAARRYFKTYWSGSECFDEKPSKYIYLVPGENVPGGTWHDETNTYDEYWGVRHKKLDHKTEIFHEPEPCPTVPYSLGFDKLYEGHLMQHAFSSRYFGNQVSKVGTFFGHRRMGSSWSFGCGFGFAKEPLGCGWTLESSPQEVWSTAAVITFQW